MLSSSVILTPLEKGNIATCKEDKEVDLEDGRCCVFLSTHGKNENEVPRELVNFLKFVKANQEESQKDFRDHFVK